MRVIAGSRRGTRLVAPPGNDIRPTADRVREALFSILGSIEGLRVLDLFAGSGALAIEALSRGASAATLVDASPTAAAAIRRNLQATRLEAELTRTDALRFLRGARAASRQYDLVFVDPPYCCAAPLGAEPAAALGPVLSAQARVICESDRHSPLELELPLLDERTYGQTLIRFHGP